jgi:hypothetical protein
MTHYVPLLEFTRGWVAEGPALAKQKTSWVAWLLLILMIPVFAYFLANSIT